MTVLSKIKSIYTDGACSGNPGPGGWGVVIYFEDGSSHELGGAAANTTNNRMEMQAAIAALQFLSDTQYSEPVTLFTDSEYLKNGVTKWIAGWKKRGWKTSQGSPVLNQELWEILDRLNSKRVDWRYVRGHTGNVGNERCDAIARAFSLGKPPALKQATPTAEPKPERSESTDTLDTSDLQKVAQDVLKATDFDTETTNHPELEIVQSKVNPSDSLNLEVPIMDVPTSNHSDVTEELPREVRVAQLRNLVETLRTADEIANQGYLITSSELADLMDVNASAVTSRGDHWVWRNWVVSRVRREGNQILWQLERVD